MSLTNFQNNRVVHRNDTSQIQLGNDRNTLIKANNNKLDSQIAQQTATNTKLDQFSGAINNSSIGDGTVKLQTYMYGHDSAGGQARALKVDSTGRLECNVADIELHTGDIALSVDGLETLIGTTNTKLQSDLDFAGQPNAIGDGSNMKRVMNYGHDSAGGQQRPLKVNGSGELSVAVTSTALPTGAATEATLAANEAHVGNIETAVELMDDVVVAQNAAHPSKANAVGGRYYVDNTFRDIRVDDIGKVIIDTPSGSDLHNAVDGTRKALFENPAGTGLTIGETNMAINQNIITQNSKIDTSNSTLSSLNGKVTAVNTGAVTISSALPAGTNNIGDVDIASALPSGSNTIGKVNVGTFDNSINVADGGGSLTVDNSVLTSLNSAINSNRVDVNIANGGFDGAVTNSALTELAAAINSDRVDVNIANGGFNGAVTNAGTFAVQVDGDALTSLQLIDDVVKAEDTAHSGGDKGIMGLSVRKDTATNLAGSDADYQPLITDANGRLYVINKTEKSYGSETSYVSGQAVSGSGTFTGSAINLDANVTAIYAEHNFSHTGIKFEILGSIDGTNFFSTGVEFNAGGMSPATLTGISTILGTSSGVIGFPPHIKFKFSNSDSSSQNATLSFVLQSS